MTREGWINLLRVALVAVVLVGLFYAFRIQTGLLDVGQEFGVLGDYNRVLNLVEESESLERVNSRARRVTHMELFSTIVNFSVTVRNAHGDTATIVFDDESPELRELSRSELKEFIEKKAGVRTFSR